MSRFNDVKRIKIFFKDPNKKSIFKIIKEVFILTITKKEIPFYYFKYAYRKNITNYLDYHSTKELNLMGNSPKLHNKDLNPIIENKLFFSFFCEQNNLKIPKLISYNFKTAFFYNNKTVQLKSKDAVTAFFTTIFKDTNLEALFFRPPSEQGGKGCFKISKASVNEDVDKAFDFLTQGTFVHTEIIKQHDAINKIHSKAVNTLRIISILTEDNEVEFIGGFYRFGVGESVVDNASSGGFIVGVNMAEGTLKKTGHYLSGYGGAEIYEHPDSKFKFEGFKIPFYQDICNDIRNAVTFFPDRYIGWDIAITNNGPLIVECNSQPHLPLSDIAHGGMLNNKHMRALLDIAKLK